MATKLTGDNFLSFVRQSSLIEQEALNRIVQDFRQHGVRLDDARAVAEEFIRRGSLTRWQADKLLQGKHKGFFLGKYRLLSLLGKGGMSSVYLAEHVLMRRRCAIKVLPSKRVNDSSYLGRFHREAQAVAALDHPNIVRAYDVDKESGGKEDEIHFLVMEYVDGTSLHDLIAKSGVLGFVDAADYLRQAAHGLSHAHKAGMVHRDIKPGNLLVDTNGIVKILDLGLARFFAEGDETSLTVAHDEKVLGTADYLAPEQALDSHRVDARADIYSLGCTFYFLLTGHPPFTEGTLAQRLMAHQTKQPPAIERDRPETPPDLSAIIRKMMAKKTDDRYQNALEVAEALDGWLQTHADDEWRRKHGRAGQSPRASDPSIPQLGSDALRRSATAQSNGGNYDATTPFPVGATVRGPDAWGVQPAGASERPQYSPAAHAAGPGSAPSTPAPAAAPPGSDLAAFLSNLNSNPAPTAKPASGKSKAKKTSKSAIPVVAEAPAPSPAAPVTPPPAAVVEAAPYWSEPPVAAPVSDVPLATPVSDISSDILAGEPVSSSPSLPMAAAVATAEPVAPPASGTRRAQKSRKTPSKTSALKPLLERVKHDRRIQLGIGGGVLLLVALLVWSLVGGKSTPDKVSPAKPGDSPGVTDNGKDPDTAPAVDTRNLIGKEILVGGTGGHFRTIKEALDYVRKFYDPASSRTVQVISVASGTYAERITVTNDQRDLNRGVRIVSKGTPPAVLAPAGNEPVIRLSKGVERLSIEGFDIKADGKPVAIELEGTLNGLRLKNLNVSGFSDSGILGKAPVGFSALGDETAVEGSTFRGGSGTAAGIRLKGASQTELPSQFKIRDCRFFGPMGIGVQLPDDARQIEIRGNIFADIDTGVKFEGPNRTWQAVSLVHNTFYRVKRPILFTELPGPLTNGLSFVRNLFAEQEGPEVIVEKGFEQPKFLENIEANVAGMEANFTSRAAPTPPETGPTEFFFNSAGKRGAPITFASTDPKSPNYLAPGTNAPQASVPNPRKDAKPFVGAVGPAP